MGVEIDEAAAQAADPDLKLVLPGRGTSLGAGWGWVVEGWTLFTSSPLMWIISIVVLVIASLALNLVPFLGWLAFQLLQPVFAAGFVAGCRAIEKGGEFEIEHLVAGFSRRFVPLVIVGLVTLAGWVVIFLVFMAVVGATVLTALTAGSYAAILEAFMASLTILGLGTLVALALIVPLMAAYWFAPALVMMHGMSPLAAMKASLFACIRNFFPFVVYGLVMGMAGVIAIIPFGLGMLVWIPVAIASTYVAYRRIFTDDTARSAVPPA